MHARVLKVPIAPSTGVLCIILYVHLEPAHHAVHAACCTRLINLNLSRVSRNVKRHVPCLLLPCRCPCGRTAMFVLHPIVVVVDHSAQSSILSSADPDSSRRKSDSSRAEHSVRSVKDGD